MVVLELKVRAGLIAAVVGVGVEAGGWKDILRFWLCTAVALYP